MKHDVSYEELSPWWKHAVVLLAAFAFSLLMWKLIG
jgi:hypothetical protein